MKQHITNTERAQRAETALYKYAEEAGTPDVVLADLLCDLMHWCDRERVVSFKGALHIAKKHHKFEKKEG